MKYDKNDWEGITTPSQEAHYWKAAPFHEGGAQQVSIFFQECQAPFEYLESMDDKSKEEYKKGFDYLTDHFGDGGSIETALYNVFQVADGKTTGYIYSAARMNHTLEIITEHFCKCLRSLLPPRSELFTLNGASIKSFVYRAISTLQIYVKMVSRIVNTDFALRKHDPWRKGEFENSLVNLFIERLKQVVWIQSVHDEIISALGSEEEKHDFRCMRLLEIFSNSDPIDVSCAVEDKAFERATHEFEKRLTVVDNGVVKGITEQVQGADSHPFIILSIFETYKNILGRIGIRGKLQLHLERLSLLLMEQLQNIESELEKLPYLDDCVEAVLKSRMFERKVQKMILAFKGIACDDSNITSLCDEISERCYFVETQLFSSWLEETFTALEHHGAALNTEEKLISIDEKGFLSVTFKGALVRIIQEERKLSSLGFDMPPELLEQMKAAKSSIHICGMLRKIVLFYNNTKESLGSEQESLLLDSFLEFEKVLSLQDSSNEKLSVSGINVKWRDTKKCETYARNLYDAAEILKNESVSIKIIHKTLTSLICRLTKLDLLNEKPLWENTFNDIEKKVFAPMKGRTTALATKWITYWNHQIFAALEPSYVHGLLNLNRNLGVVRCEIHLGENGVVLVPDISEIRIRLYSQIDSFISFPGRSFKGFGDGFNFNEMVVMNGEVVAIVYDVVESICNSLGGKLQLYDRWACLCRLSDISAYIDHFCIEASDFQSNFQGVKETGKDVSDIPDILIVRDCIHISLHKFRTCLGERLLVLHQCILDGLRANIIHEYSVLTDYFEKTCVLMKNVPSDIAGLTLSRKALADAIAKKKSIKDISVKCEEKLEMFLTNAARKNKHENYTSELLDIESELLHHSLLSDIDTKLDDYSNVLEKAEELVIHQIERKMIELSESMKSFHQKWTEYKVNTGKMNIGKCTESDYFDLRESLAKLKAKINVVNGEAASIAVEELTLTELETIESEIELFIKARNLANVYSAEFNALSGRMWISLRNDLVKISQFIIKWKRDVAQLDGVIDICNGDFQYLKEIGSIVPILKYCTGEDFKEVHWTELLQGRLQLSTAISIESLQFRHFIEAYEILLEPSSISYIEDLQNRAQGEVIVRDALQEVVVWSKTAELKLYSHRDTKGQTFLVTQWKETLASVGEKLSILMSLRDSQFYDAIGDTVTLYEKRILILNNILQNMNCIQRKWLYLEPVLSNNALPSESKRFQQIDESFRSLLSDINADPRFFRLVEGNNVSGLEFELQKNIKELELCQKSLTDFLQNKRFVMPRLYFLGDDSLLQILGRSKKPNTLQTYMKDLFQGIDSVLFDSSQTEIVGMRSAQGEEVSFDQVTINVNDNPIEVWLNNLVSKHKITLRNKLEACIHSSQDLVNNLYHFPSQILCLCEVINFARSVETNLDRSGGLVRLHETLTGELRKCTKCILSCKDLDRLKLQALILDLIHNKDVIDYLIVQGVTIKSDWSWESQLRFYSFGNQSCNARMGNVMLDYSFEYQGNDKKLVHTSLTDKCFLNLIHGMKFGFGGNPFGPAGTGKTETVKFLGALLGRQVLVFNCDDGLDFESMGQIFIGIVMTGAWGCFDEFNRLKEEQLSAIANQIQQIQNAIKNKLESVMLLSKKITVNTHAALFVTLNPVGKDYGGRSELPSNLKVLFRPIAMSLPDDRKIAEVTLLASGFHNARELGMKACFILSSSRSFLSPQKHYDWGLRALMAVLRTTTKIIQNTHINQGDLLHWETSALIRAMKNNIMGKLTTHDLPLFLRLIRDSFPQAEELLGVSSRGGGKESTNSINDIEESDKVMQLQVSLEERKGCIILGPVGSGKSFLWQTLKNNFIKRGELIETFVLNPKVMEKGKLLGSLDSNTGEWKDGLLTTIIRKVTSEDLAHSKNWIICDGDIDPEWIESLNSVLDDNQLLTLPNGERFKLGDNVNFLFETRDLKFASPATISRNAIVTLECRSVSFSQHIINKWLDTEIHPDAIQIWMKQHFVPAVDFASKCESLIQLDSLALTCNCLNHVKDCKSESEFINKLSRALCVHLPSNDREKRIKEIMNCIGNSSVLNCNDHFCLGTNVSARDFFERHGIIRIRAVENTWEILRSWTASNEHIMLIGSPGSGKSFMIQSCFTYQQGQARVHVFNCTHESKPKDIIQIVKEVCSLCSKADGMRYFPRDTNKTVLHIKYIESVSSDEYGTCSLVSFLHQLIDYHGFYDDYGTFYQLINFQLILSTKSHQVDKLMMKRFRISFVDNPTKNDLILFCDALISDSSSASQLLDENTNVHIACVVADIFELIVSLCNESECMMRLHLPFNCLKNMLENLCRYKSCGKGIGIVLALEFGYAIDDILNSIERLDLEKNKLTAAVASYLKEEKLIDSTDVMHYYSSVEKINEGQNQLVVLTEGEMKKKILSIDTSPVRRQSHLILQKTSYYFSRIEHGLITGHQNLLLIGEQGTGRKTTLRLVCSQHSIHYDTLSLTTRWDISSFQTQLKLILLQTGVEGKEVCLHLEMHQLTSPLMFVMVSEIMSICPSLIYSFFSPKERGVIYSSLEENVQSIDDHSSTTELQFLRKINRNLHICLSINDSDLDAFITKYPSLIKKTSKVCFVPWTNHCCQKICRSIIDEMAMKREKDDNNFFVEFEPTTVEAAFIDVHKTTTNMGSTNHEFKDVVQTWANLITDKNVIMQKKFDRLRLGLSKLSETNESVYLLQEIAKETQTKVIQAQITADEAMKAITDEMTSAQIKNNEIRKLRSELEMKSKETQLRKKDVEKELAKIQPVLKLAQEGVKHIKRDNLNEIRSMKTPPLAVSDVLSGVLMLLGIQDLSWLSMKKFLGRREVKEEILNFDSCGISSKILQQVKSLIKKKEKSFESVNIKRVSVAAAPLASWVCAHVKYAEVVKSIQPLEEELKCQSAELEGCKHNIEDCENEMLQINNRVTQLRCSFSSKVQEAEHLKYEQKTMQSRYDRASKILEKLKGERLRWENHISALEEEKTTVWLDILLCSAFIVYLGAQTESRRNQYSQSWGRLLQKYDYNSVSFDFAKTLGTEREHSFWCNWGLPCDELCLQNAAILSSSKTKALLVVDPDDLATRWLRKYASLGDAKLEIISNTDSNLWKIFELCVRLGKSLLIEDCMHVDPFLYPILRNEIIHEGSRKVVLLGNKKVDYNNDFRLIISSKRKFKGLKQSIHALMRHVRFAMSSSGMETVLASVLVHQGNPDLERSLKETKEQEEIHNEKIELLENKLLEVLGSTNGDIIEDDILVQSLIDTVESAKAISELITRNNVMREKLEETKATYSEASSFGSKLYSLLMQLKKLNHFYRFGVSSFLLFFRKSIQNLPDPKGDRMIEHLIHSFIAAFAPSIDRNDYFTFLLYMSYCLKSNLWTDLTWEFFIGSSTSLHECAGNYAIPTWANSDRLPYYLSLCDNFPNIIEGMNINHSAWEQWSMSESCYQSFPKCNLSSVERLLLVKALRPDNLNIAAATFCHTELGLDCTRTSAPQYTISDIWDLRCTFMAPIMLLTSEENDLTKDLEALATKVLGKDSKRFKSLGMGAGQEHKALKLLKEAMSQGQWLILCNIHLSLTFIPTLERELDNRTEPHSKFQLWLTTEENHSISERLIEKCQKYWYKRPIGLNESMKNIHKVWIENGISIGNNERSSRFLLVLAWVHSLLIERKKFIPQGWKHCYNFSSGDLLAAVKLVDEYTNGSDYNAFQRLVLDFIYGGRIDDINDRMIIEKYVRKYFSENVLQGGEELFQGWKNPSQWDSQTYHRAIQKIPYTYNPSWFHLPENVNKTFDREQTQRMIDQLKLIHADSLHTDDAHALKMKSVRVLMEVWSSVRSFELEGYIKQIGCSSKNEFEDSTYHPLMIFFHDETQLGVQLYKVINETFDQFEIMLGDGLKGVSQHREAIDDIYRGNTPSLWREEWSGPSRATNWLRGVSIRLKALAHNQKDFLDTKRIASMNFEHFFRPHSFLSSFQQVSSRFLCCPMDELVLSSQVLSANPKSLENELYIDISGLFIQGATLKEKSTGDLILSEVDIKSPEISPAPPIRMAYVKEKSRIHPGVNSLAYASSTVPLYSSVHRCEKICDVQVQHTNTQRPEWPLLSGVAFLGTARN